MDFEKRLERAIQRGQHAKTERGKKTADLQLSAEELRHLHSVVRLELTDKIEHGLKQLSEHFPGFRYQTVVGEDGWGARILRDDFAINEGKKSNVYSRLELLIRPYSQAHIVELTAKGTIRNKEVISRNHFQFLDKVDTESYSELIEVWILEYAENYAKEF